MRLRSKTPEIIRLWKLNHTKAEIARLVGCTRANVTKAIQKHLGWDNRVEALSDKHHAALMRLADRAYTTPDDMARKLLVIAIEDALANGRKAA